MNNIIKLTLSLLVLVALFKCAQAQSTLVLGAQLLDQSPRNFPWVDFERPEPIPSQDHGMAEYNLDVDSRKPVYSFGDNWSINKTIRNQTSFNSFWNPTPYTKQVLLNLTLTQTSVPNVYSFVNDNYFPIDGEGWDVPQGTDEYLANGDGDGKYHNFHFCIQIHARFAYKGGEKFHFLGDDDLWVFINNQLVIDLGGPHTKQEADFSLDTVASSYGLATGNDYRFDFFYCERHTVLSECELTSSLEIYCAYFDWCDACDGDGQSCCQPGDCNDNNPCTTDKCAVFDPPTVACQNIPINCTASSICVTAQCVVSQGGCVETNITCPDDGNKCTIEQCSPTQGGCIAPQKNCDDGQGLCTTKVCTPSTGACSFPPVNCDDGNPCTTDGCSPSTGCTHTATLCNDNNKCTIDNCNSSVSSGCTYTPVNCNDNNACTQDSCTSSTGLCNNAPLNCDDQNACTINNCNTQTGCDFSQQVNCDDGNACTTDTCSTSSGCQHTQLNCNDNNLCHTFTCSSTLGCQYQNVSCDDNNPCTVDSCTASSGCQHIQKNCNDQNACTTDTCGTSNDPNSPNYCNHVPITCNDNSACTNDSCAAASGCVYQPITCDDGDVCTTDTCNANSGCVFTPNPGCNACYNGDVPRYDCSYTDKCHPIQCYVDGNGNPACEFYANVTCNDNNPCTNDTCTSSTGSCVFTPVVCDDNNDCTNDACDQTSGQCVFTPINCNDQNNCTKDYCTAGVCHNDLVSPGCVVCGTGSCITTDYCNPLSCSAQGVCTPTSISCNDNNACTQDSCQVLGVFNTSCVNTPIDCSANLSKSVNACAPAFCSAQSGCYQQPVSCDDGNPCTADSCVLAGANNYTCLNTPICPSTDLCNPVACDPNTLKCTVNPVNCNDNNPCTNDTCYVANNTAQCSNVLYNFKQTDACHPVFCNVTTGATYVVPVNCSDGIKCTIDTCNTTDGTCSHVLNPCVDASNCTVDSCDNNAPSVDGCVHTPLTCQSTICNSASCDVHKGCVFTPIPCKVANSSNYCSSSSCDEIAGCLNSTRICVLSTLKTDPSHWYDPFPSLFNSAGQKSNDCFNAICDYSRQLCVVSKKTPWTAYCGAAYLTAAQKAGAISAGVIAGVVIAAVVFAALAGFGGKKGYDAWVRMRDERIAGAQGNPMYVAPKGSGTSPLYAS